MISPARLAANRANAQKSTGPRTVAGKQRAARKGDKNVGPTTPTGKKRSAQNARRHGLTLPLSRDPGVAAATTGFAHAIAGTKQNAELLGLAIRVAGAELDLRHARHARRELLAGEPFAHIRRLA